MIEDKTILPMGATSPLQLRFRVLCATNVDPEQMVGDGLLRQDLLFRINTMVLTLPPLRLRRDDVTLLMAHFLAMSFLVRLATLIPPPSSATDIFNMPDEWDADKFMVAWVGLP